MPSGNILNGNYLRGSNPIFLFSSGALQSSVNFQGAFVLKRNRAAAPGAGGEKRRPAPTWPEPDREALWVLRPRPDSRTQRSLCDAGAAQERPRSRAHSARASQSLRGT